MKLAQAKYLLSKVCEFEKIISNKFTCKPSVVIAGDFNSTPGDKVWLAFAAWLSQTFATIVTVIVIDCGV